MDIRIQKPSDQPSGTWRLLHDLEAGLQCGRYSSLRMVVAFAKSGPLRKLEAAIKSFRSAGGEIQVVFGLDQNGTSLEALTFALGSFNEVRVATGQGRLVATFHPKVFIFEGPDHAEVTIGSNNLTIGGTEINPEAMVRLRFSLPAQVEFLAEVRAVWEDAAAASVLLTDELLSELVERGVVQPEPRGGSRSRDEAPGDPAGYTGARKMEGFPKFEQSPPRPFPKGGTRTRPQDGSAVIEIEPPAAASTILAIQVIPHHNGEVFLSKTAVDQNPGFFGWPFTGETTPKRPQNPSYPQREPDPVVSIEVINPAGATVFRQERHSLNTVYYSTKSEIRVTVPPDVVRKTPAYSVLVMEASDSSDGLDYQMIFYAPGSPEYDAFLAACNQTMPSGGKPVARRFGWL